MWEAIRAFWVEGSLVQTITVICFTCGIGLWLGKLRIGAVSLGGVCVFFLGIMMAHFGVRLNEPMLIFAQNFGLVLFIYALGVQVGPGFVATFRTHGLSLNLWSLGLILAGTLAAVVLVLVGYDTAGNVIGVLSGAVTNTPALGAAQQALLSAHGSNSATHEAMNAMALATAITYPIGTVGVFVVLELLRIIFPRRAKQKATEEPNEHHIAEYYLVNEGIVGHTLEEVHKTFPQDYVISRIYRDNDLITPTTDTTFRYGDHLLVVCKTDSVEILEHIFGQLVEQEEKRTDWYSIESSDNLVSKRIIISKAGINGRSLRDLRLRNRYGINITRINRAELDLVPTPDLILQLGDRITAVGPEDKVDLLAKELGDQLKPLDTPYLVSIFIGMGLGLLLGAIPITLPGMNAPIRLGIAGGPIIMGILMGAYGVRFRLNTYITHSANLMLRTLGITLYLGGLGLSSGADFFGMLTEGPGLSWLGVGAALTIIPSFLVGLLALLMTGQTFSTIAGWICGAMANPIALDYMTDRLEDDTPTVSYASVYPMGMFLRVIIAQLLVTILSA